MKEVLVDSLGRKPCSLCGVVKPLGEFYKSSTTKCGHQSQCRACYRARPASKRLRLPGYASWLQMNSRCANPKGTSYQHYGARGIRVCPEWRGKGGYERFIAYIGPRPSSRHQVDRIDNDRNYEPGNVRWVLPVVNIRNRSNTRHLTCNGETKPLGEWAELAGLPPVKIRTRLRQGWTPEEAVFGRPRKKRLAKAAS